MTVSNDDFKKAAMRAEAEAATANLKALMGKQRFLDVPERVTEFELVHEHVITAGTRISGVLACDSFHLDGVIAEQDDNAKSLGLVNKQHGIPSQFFAVMNAEHSVNPPEGVHYDFMAEHLRDSYQAFFKKLEI